MIEPKYTANIRGDNTTLIQGDNPTVTINPPQDPVIRDHLLQLLTLTPEPSTDAYYDGKSARMRHILEGLDAPRPRWQPAIAEMLTHVQVCVIRASSGQGKSTLLYRYLHDHFTADAMYRLTTCVKEEHAIQVASYLRTLISAADYPFLVFVDNLDSSVQMWHKVVAELAGQNIRFLITTREEDWYRYGQSLNAFVWGTIKPDLSREEARAIFLYFRKQNKIDPSVASADWAYEQVADKQLLIEFVYLITHGQMLAERIDQQIKAISQSEADAAKLNILRLVSTAQVYGTRLNTQALLQIVNSQRDMASVLESLEAEYIENYNGYWEALHLVRAEHLMRRLHKIHPIEQTLNQLITNLGLDDLAALILNVFADPELNIDQMLPVLVVRCQTKPLSFINTIVESLFVASEEQYIQVHESLFDEIVAEGGPDILILIAGATLPIGEPASLPFIREQLPRLNDLLARFQSREELGTQRTIQRFLSEILPTISLTWNIPLVDLAGFSNWCQAFDVLQAEVKAFLSNADWQNLVYQTNSIDAAHMLYIYYQQLPEEYTYFLSNNKHHLFSQFKLWFKVLDIREDNKDLYIQFLVDESSDSKSIKDQAVSRLEYLQLCFPQHQTYHAQGIYPSLGTQLPELDDSHKNLSSQTLNWLLYAPKNKLYRELLEKHYASHSAFDWMHHWFELRRKTLGFLQSLSGTYTHMFKQRQMNKIPASTTGKELTNLYKQTPVLPIRLLSQFNSQDEVIRNWRRPMNNFLNQLDHQSPQDTKNHLMRYNLKEAVQNTPGMHQAFRTIFQLEGDQFDMAALDASELATYGYLADVLDYWVACPPPQKGSLQDNVQRWKDTQTQDFIAHVQQALKPLADIGMQFSYPGGLLVEEQLVGLCIGYEIADFTQYLTQAGLIADSIARTDLEYSFLYLVPTVRRQLCTTFVIRVAQYMLQQLLAGEEVQESVNLVKIPNGLADTLPDVNTHLLPEIILTTPIREIYTRLVIERNKLYFAYNQLTTNNAEEATLLALYEQDTLTQVVNLRQKFAEAVTLAHIYEDTGVARVEWSDLWGAADQLVQDLADLSTILQRYTPQSAQQSWNLDALLYRYLNRKYLEL